SSVGLDQVKFKSVTTTGACTLLLAQNGTIYFGSKGSVGRKGGWDRNDVPSGIFQVSNISLPLGVKAVDIGGTNTVTQVLGDDGNIYVYGKNDNGACTPNGTAPTNCLGDVLPREARIN
ncbi:hypothetical protein AKO1_015424, partial [Acrasis kona]